MSALAAFTTLMESTPPVYATSRMDVINDVVSRNHLMPHFLRGRGEKQLFQGGAQITDRILLSLQTNFRAYGRGSTHQYTNRQSGTNWTQEWSYYTTEMTWDEAEILHNDFSTMTREAQEEVLKSVKYQKEQELATDIVEGMDAVLWAKPDLSTMETVSSGTTREFMSIPCVINEETNGLYDYTETGTFTTVQGISPTQYPNWVPEQVNYDFSSYTDARIGLFHAFRLMRRRLRFRAPSKYQKYFEGNNYDRQFISTSEGGVMLYEDTLAADGDFFKTIAGDDASFGQEVHFHGHVIEEVEALETAELYPGSGSVLKKWSEATVAAPRYYWINTKYLKVFFHRDKYLEKRKPKEPSDQIEQWVQPVVLWWNMFAASRRRHGIVYPIA